MQKRARRAVLVTYLVGLTFGATLQAQEPLSLASVSYRSLPQEQVLEGVVEAVKRSTVAAQITARVAEINFDVDDVVPKDSVLIRFRDKEQGAKVAQAKAAIQEAKARLVEAETEFRRIKNLTERQLVAAAELDKASAAYSTAQARLKAAEAQVQSVQESFSHTVVTAPYSGIVVARHVEVGETVQIGQPLMTGLSLDHLRVLVQLPQSVAEGLRGEVQARVLVGGETPRSIPARKVTVFPYADAESHTVRARLDLPEATAGLYPGAFVKVVFNTGERRRLVLPRQAVVQRSEVTAVYVVDKAGRVSMRQIRPGTLFGDEIEVLAGVGEGEQVALDPVQATLLLKQQAARHE